MADEREDTGSDPFSEMPFTHVLDRRALDRPSLTPDDPAGLPAGARTVDVLVDPDAWAVLGLGWDGRRLAGDPAHPASGRAPTCYLGRDTAGADWFARPVEGADPADHPGLRSLVDLVDPIEAGAAATAQALLGWHLTHPRCPRCGGPTRSRDAGWLRVCEADGSQHHPRTDLAVIMAVIDEADRILLARNTGWPQGRLSVLAGFVEPGERLVDAVAREVFEEVGLEVGDIVHHADQPWPFPGSLMIGFTARARSAELTLDPREIAEARWVSRAEVPGLLASGAWRYRGRSSISGRLIEHWYGGPLPT